MASSVRACVVEFNVAVDMTKMISHGASPLSHRRSTFTHLTLGFSLIPVNFSFFEIFFCGILPLHGHATQVKLGIDGILGHGAYGSPTHIFYIARQIWMA
jgi:hypothetical protein